MLAERFHMDEAYLKALNPGAVFGRPGTVIKVANVGADAATPVARIVADKPRKQLRAYDASGRLVGAVNMLVDITERKSAEARQKTLLDELNHRVKNTLATVQSLATQTIRGSGVSLAVRRTFEGRLFALSRAHDQLTRTQWESADLKSILEDIFAPFGVGQQSRVALDGTSVKLPPQPALLLAMVLHELATNAVKYGALSQNSGQLAINWKSGRGNRLLLTWEERATLNVVPTRRGGGFGMQLIDKGVRHNLGGDTKVEFRPTGLYVELNVPLEPSKEPHQAAEGGCLGLSSYSRTPISSLAWRRRSENSRVRLLRMVIMMLGCAAVSSCSCCTLSP